MGKRKRKRKRRAMYSWENNKGGRGGWSYNIERDKSPRGFEIPIVKTCPYALGSKGVISIPTNIIGQLAYAVREEKNVEWAILLHGERSENGLEVRIKGISVPGDQRRSTTKVKLPERVFESDVVGVLHSHHGMGARFSSTDDDELNPFFPASIVISSLISSEEGRLLGFEYEAEGRVKLPCGTLGIVEFTVLPEGVEDWPFKWVPKMSADTTAVGLGDCKNWKAGEGENRYRFSMEAACGLAEDTERAKFAVFGMVKEGIVEELPQPFTEIQPQSSGGKGYKVVDKRLNGAVTVEKRYLGPGSEAEKPQALLSQRSAYSGYVDEDYIREYESERERDEGRDCEKDTSLEQWRGDGYRSGYGGVD